MRLTPLKFSQGKVSSTPHRGRRRGGGEKEGLLPPHPTFESGGGEGGEVSFSTFSHLCG